jgi:hypothetical protein
MPAARKRPEGRPKPVGGSARDVLAAEEFGVPARDPSLHHGPVRLPGDPSGIAEPHDVLAAEEFALPAPRQATVVPSPQVRRPGVPAKALGAMLALLLAHRLLRRSRRR